MSLSFRRFFKLIAISVESGKRSIRACSSVKKKDLRSNFVNLLYLKLHPNTFIISLHSKSIKVLKYKNLHVERKNQCKYKIIAPERSK